MMDEKMMDEKGKTIIGRKGIRILFIILLILSASGYYIYQNMTELGLTKPVLIVKVTTGRSSTGTPVITNATFEQSSVAFFYKTANTPADFPEIDANIRINKLESIPASYWAAVPFRGEGEYTLKIYFRDEYKPKKDSILIISLRILSRTGTVAYKTTAFWIWE